MFCEQDYRDAGNMVISECEKALGAIEFAQIEQYMEMILSAEKVFL